MSAPGIPRRILKVVKYFILTPGSVVSLGFLYMFFNFVDLRTNVPIPLSSAKCILNLSAKLKSIRVHLVHGSKMYVIF